MSQRRAGNKTNLLLDLWGLSLRGSFMHGSNMRRVCIPKMLLDLQPEMSTSRRCSRRETRTDSELRCLSLRSSSEHSDRRTVRLTNESVSTGFLRRSWFVSERPKSPNSRLLSCNCSRELRSLANAMMSVQERQLLRNAIRQFRHDRSVNGLYKLCRTAFACLELQRHSSEKVQVKKFKFVSLLRNAIAPYLRDEFDQLCLLYAPDYQPPTPFDFDADCSAYQRPRRSCSLPNLAQKPNVLTRQSYFAQRRM